MCTKKYRAAQYYFVSHAARFGQVYHWENQYTAVKSRSEQTDKQN